MKKTVKPFMVFAFILFSIMLVHGTGCKKNTDKEEECRTCKAFGVDDIIDEETVCSDAEETAFRTKNAGHEIACQ
jgi:hypothetical protein